MFSSAFGIIMTIILVGYGGYYAYNIIKDLYFDKSDEVVQEEAVEEKEVDISDDVKSFEKYAANEDEQAAALRKAAEEAAQKREEEGDPTGDPTHDENEPTAKTEEGTTETPPQTDGEGNENQTTEETDNTPPSNPIPEPTTQEPDREEDNSREEDSKEAPSEPTTDRQPQIVDIGKAELPQGAEESFLNVMAALKGAESDDVPQMSGGHEANELVNNADDIFEQGMYYFRENLRSA